ncbi:acyltransferase family protein [Aureimonas pseudogalii]|uniref:Peptidoglycan/LPS O-acetylase OafA/YrhL n=1 Tax=Aureimonas pseudogalii TaxID=1744844 RepID=A0A7W6E8U9_9HYPH|nr:acyltransferase [Aureimonas pseudogalii]MBB3996848.1 peptidoglycan/LPS O-acetylase OafA/YrhL [Aureimonas pseudogalii]
MHSPPLSSFDGRRDNNFTLIRLVFALMVLWGHAWPITGSGFDPLSTMVMPGTWVGAISVTGFFAISGFLVTASFENRPWRDYVLSRALRLYPAALVFFALMLGVLGPALTSVSVEEFFTSPQTWSFALGALLLDLRTVLPGVFDNRPFSNSVNGSLWTVILELRCYVAVLVFGLLGGFRRRTIANGVLGSMLVLGYFLQPYLPSIGVAPNHNRQYAYFVIGSLLWINRDLVRLNGIAATVAMLVPWLFLGTVLFPIVLSVCLVYAIFVLAYTAPHVDLDRFGDFSYGIYIYAWPVQQAIWWSGQTPWQNGLIATAIVVPLSIASWYAIERPALRWRGNLGQRLRAGA